MAPVSVDFQRTDVPQAVIIAETFDDFFDPIGREIPKALLPLVNTPLLDYNLDWLYRNNIHDIIICCKATLHGDIIRNHCSSVIQRRRWNRVNIRVIGSDETRSAGDALRDLYGRNIITSDFVLLRADTLASFPVKNLLNVHKFNVQKDPKAVMTCALVPTPPQKNRFTLKVTTVSTVTGRIFKYIRHRLGSNAPVPRDLVLLMGKLVLSPHLTDPSVYVCSPAVLSLFADNFDLVSPDSLIKTLVEHDDLNDCHVYQYVVTAGTGATLITWRDYEMASRLMIQKVFYPLKPEFSLSTGRYRYWHQPTKNMYYTNSSNLSNFFRLDEETQTSFVGNEVVFGEGFGAGKSCYVDFCVFGTCCQLGDNVSLQAAFVGDNCRIDSNCTASYCYLGPNVTLLPNTVLEPGCVVASGVTLGPNTTIKKGSLVANTAIYDKLDEFEQSDNPKKVSETGILMTQPIEGVEMTHEDGSILLLWGAKKTEYKEGDASDSDEDEVDAAQEEEIDEDERKQLDFLSEVMDSLVTGIKEVTDAGKVALEINASRYAYNIPLEKMQEIVFLGILRCYEDNESTPKYSADVTKLNFPAWPSMKKGLSRFQEVLKKYMKTYNDYLNTFERMVKVDERLLTVAVKVFYELTQELELIEDYKLIIWFRKHEETEIFLKLKDKVSQFIQWLENADEESSDDD